MKLLAKLNNCQRRFLPVLAILFAQVALGQGIVFVQMPPTVRSTNGLTPGLTPVTFPEDALGTYVGDPLPIVINGQTVCTFSSGKSFLIAATSGSGIIGQQPFQDFPDDVWVVPFTAGQEIGPDAAGYGWFNGGLLASSIDSATQGEGPLYGGYFAWVEAAYLGFDFEQNGQTYYGWMEVGSPYVTGTGGVGWVYSYAYETTPKTPIFAGEMPLAALAVPQIVRPGNLRLKWQSQTNMAYQVQFKEQLDSVFWTNLDLTIIATATNTSADVPMVGTARFYRVVQVR